MGRFTLQLRGLKTEGFARGVRSRIYFLSICFFLFFLLAPGITNGYIASLSGSLGWWESSILMPERLRGVFRGAHASLHLAVEN